MKQVLTLFSLVLLSVSLTAQTDINVFNATGGGYSVTRLTDYQCLGINPANLGWTWSDNSMNLGLFETGLSIHTGALTRKQVMKDMFDESIHLDMDQRRDAASAFTGEGLWAQGGMTWLGFSYQDDKLGGFAFSARDRGFWNTVFNSEAARFVFLGFYDPYFDSLVVNGEDTVGYATDPEFASKVYAGTNMQFIWYREYNLAYGRKMLEYNDWKLFAGLGLKYLVGYGSFQYLQNEAGLTAYSALAPVFEVDYDTPTPSKIDGTGLKKTGSGFGADLGVSVHYGEDWKFSLALNDIGSIKWDGNVYEGQEVKVWKIETPGIDNYNIFSQGELISTDNAPDDPGQWKGLENKTVALPMHLRTGISYKLHEKVEAGADLYLPLTEDVPGAYEGPLFGLGAVYEPAKWVQLSLGLVSGKETGTNIPIGISFFPARDEDGSWQLGIALRDVSTYLKESEPTVSFAFGFLRFSFGQKKH
ncbi:MAG TPA: DUF5723 family protein [Bacteroidales bacterium]|nr:DUF5723 family protein [Bacteroidales bacterium]HSA44757.1 DUF5723 family protein [Bacteroidales bacterium]